MNYFKVILRILIISSPLWLNDFYMRYLSNDDDHLRMVLDLIFYIAFQSILIYLAYEAGWFKISDLNLDIHDLQKQILMGIGIFIFVFLISILLTVVRIYLNKVFNLGIDKPGHPPINIESELIKFVYIIYLAISAGIYEEIVYRGIIISQLRKIKDKNFILVLGSALVFGLIHWSLGFAIMSLAFILGAFWAFLFIKTKKLLPIIIAHFLFDFLTLYDLHIYVNEFLGLNS